MIARCEPVPIADLIEGDRVLWRGFILPVRRAKRERGFPFPADVSWWTIRFEAMAWGAPTEIILGEQERIMRFVPRNLQPKCVRCPALAVVIVDNFPFCFSCHTSAILNAEAVQRKRA